MFGKIAAALAAVFMCFWSAFGGAAYPAFYHNAKPAAKLPGLAEGFIPQGVSFDAQTQTTLVCGYLEEGVSRLYAIRETGDARCFYLEKPDGSAYTGHAGGVTVAGSRVLISNGSRLWILPLAAVQTARDGETLRFSGSVETPCRASFCSCDGERIFVGEFHAEGYETDSSHRVTTADGADYQALVFAYTLDDAFFAEDAAPVPVAAYAVCDQAQGFSMLPDGSAALSCSQGFSDASLLLYRADGAPDGVFPLAGGEIPLYVLDGARERETLRLPHMSEDLEYTTEGLLICFESAALKYGAGFAPFSVNRVMRYTPAFG